MSPSSNQMRQPLVLVGAVIAMAACGKTSPSASSADTAAADSISAHAKPSGLPDTLEKMLSSRVFAAFAGAQKSSEDTARVRLASVGSCPTDTVEVLVIAMKDSKRLKHDKDYGRSNGYILARLVNPSTCRTAVIPIDPQKQVYWVARMEPVTKTFDSRVVNDSLDLLGPLGFNKCPIEHPSDNDRAEVRLAAQVCSSMGPSPSGEPRQINSSEEMSLWAACSEGCCYTDRAGQPENATAATRR